MRYWDLLSGDRNRIPILCTKHSSTITKNIDTVKKIGSINDKIIAHPINTYLLTLRAGKKGHGERTKKGSFLIQ